ncbi:hydantoinase/oxoprolinase family protein [Aestuariivirga sp.]|uniref:hydantoinase/oxoprolinase family protein n=1 Tax=Aestuariivirga sp. TaxID=2650926 RepID=UPI0025C1FAA7|nr:hydantoinase/oxoprolinase family protein [Aestuariivirga sp.]MCA3555544.1 hydantoinase/oxoprolinase family protein [Aestuariivirga sp.]
MTARTYLIGVDTGGTYTDAAVIEAQGHRVVASAKSITTKGDLSIGVTGAITAAVAKLPEGLRPADISLVSVSTTLATNAVVEGHGSAVGAILIGFDQAMADRTGIARAFPGMPIAMIPGGHDHNGEEARPLDVEALAAAVAKMPADAFAIAAAFAVRNPEHEQRAGQIVARATGKPATLSTELTSALDAPRRALTAVLNARLISRVSMLISAVRRSMAELGIVCPLMIVKGDGTLALAERVALRPIETVLSGPAASLVGASWLCGRNDFIMSDMGGTTTDLGVLLGGRPRVAEQGAEVGGWRTMVRAIDVKTIGLGGDSEIAIGLNGAIGVGPQRVAPVSLLASRYPEVAAMLEADLADTEGGSLHGKFVLKPFGASDALTAEVTPKEAELLAMVGERPKPIRRIAVSSAAQRALASLKRKGLVQTGGFTPSDAAHVLGLQNNWPGPAAELAARLMVRFRDMKPGDAERVRGFCREVWSETVRLTSTVILETAFGKSFGGHELVDAVSSGRGRLGLVKVALTPSIPVVAVGGPVRVYYEEVGKRLGCEMIFPPFFDVANAVGAATGVVAQAVTVAVEGDGSGLFRVLGPNGASAFASGAQALVAAEEQARALALEAVRQLGAKDAQVQVSVRKSHLPDAADDNGLLEAKIRAEAIGRPETGSR